MWRIRTTRLIDQLMIAAARIDLAGDHSAAQHLGMAASPVGIDHKTIGEGPANIHPNSMCITCLHDRVASYSYSYSTRAPTRAPTRTRTRTRNRNRNRNRNRIEIEIEIVIVIETTHSATKTRSRVLLSIDHQREDTSRKSDSKRIE